MIKAIVFDIDGTLYSKTILLLRFLLRYPLHLNRLMRFVRVREMLRAHKNIKHEQYSLLSKIENKRYEDTKDYYEDLIYGKLFNLTPKAKREVKSTIKELKEKGYKLGILTECPYEVKLERLGLSKSDFEIMINLEDYGILKPTKECFSILIRKAKLKPEEILYIGDRLDTDVIGAKSCGINTCMISNKTVEEANYSIKSLAGIMTAIDDMV